MVHNPDIDVYHNSRASVNPFLEARRGIGINNATLWASSCRCDSNCNAAVASPHPFDNTITSNTCRYSSQLVDPLNQGTFVVVSAACRTRGTGNRFSVCRSSRSRCILNPCMGWPAPRGPPQPAGWRGPELSFHLRGGRGPDISFCVAVAGPRMLFCAGWVYISSPHCR